MQIAHQQHLWSAGMQAATESTISHAETSDTNDGFLRRPVKIATFAWNVNTPLWHTFNPWAAFCEDPRVINRLAHFKNLRMNLHVQFLINGNPFYYGRAIASYIPLPGSDNYSQVEEGSFLQIVPSSQRPHVYLDPCKSEGGELVLPFLFPKTYMDIPASEWSKMGEIVLQSINPLLHANEQGDSVDITVFAFASEVSLNTPTCQVPSTLVPQGADEYGKISYPAHLVANWAGRLANAPVIGAYARATEMMATATAGIAAMFGYSRPSEPAENICTMKLYPGHATTNEKDDCVTLAVDAKREVTIDPRVVGLTPQDEMALVPLAMRESYFGVIPWNTDNVPDEHLCSIRVSPMLGNSITFGAIKYAMTPMAFVAHPFKYWKGSINVRMQVVCSAYHRGRLRVVWDPDHCNDNCAEMFNTNYSMLLDITESQDITFKIGWGANTDYLPVPDVTHISECLQYANYSNNAFGCNGTLSVYVVNGLTCPGSINTPIEINLFCSAADDFEVAVPDDVKLKAIKVDETVGPPPPPTDGPGSTPTPPAENDIIVAKREFAFGMLYVGNQTLNHPQPTNYDNRTQAVWADSSAMAYKVPAYGGGVNAVTSGDIVFEFRNHEQQAKDISVTIGGTVANGTLAPNVGATLTLTVPNVTLAAGYQELDATIESTRDALLNYVTSYYPQSYIRLFVRGNDLLELISEPAAQVVNIGSYDAVQNNGANPRTLTVVAPSNYAVGTKGFFASRFGLTVNTIDASRDGSISLTYQNHCAAPIAVGDQWECTEGLSTNWTCELTKAVYWYDSSLPAPQGVTVRSDKKREYEEAFQRHLDEIVQAELEDMEDFQENVEPLSEDRAPFLEPIPEGNCLRRFQGLNIDQISEEHEEQSFIQEVTDVEFYISPSSSDEEKKEEADASELVPQGDDTPEERADDKDDANAPEHEAEDLTMGPTSDVPGLPQIYFGEQITSWRQLLKRYSHLMVVSGGDSFRYRFPAISPYKDEVIAGVFGISIHLLHYVMPAYVCQRGGVKFRYLDRNAQAMFVVDRVNYAPLQGYAALTAVLDDVCSFSGGHPQNLLITNYGSVEIPWYSQYRFMPARSYELDDPDNFVERGFVQMFRRGAVSGFSSLVTMAVAEDFSLSGFLSVPYMVPT